MNCFSEWITLALQDNYISLLYFTDELSRLVALGLFLVLIYLVALIPCKLSVSASKYSTIPTNNLIY
jgi:uncharacterized membrane protein YqjE